MVETLKQNFYWVVPVVLPLGFLFANVFVKYIFGQREFHFMGGDLALCGSALFTGTALRQILSQTLTESSEIVLAVSLILVFLFGWFGCLSIGRYRRF